MRKVFDLHKGSEVVISFFWKKVLQKILQLKFKILKLKNISFFKHAVIIIACYILIDRV